MTTTQTMAVRPAHAHGWVVDGAIALIAAVFAAIVIIASLHAVAQRHEQACEMQYGFQGYSTAQAKIICHNGG